MKIGIILCANLEKAQYLYKYIRILDSFECEYDIIYWNRNLSDYKINCRGKYFSFDEEIDSFVSFRFKIRKYIKFFRFVHRSIKHNKYDKLIIFTTPAAVVLSDLCLGKFKNKYLFDYRDLTKEYFYPYKKLVQKLAINSELFAVSSPGYLRVFNIDKIKNYVLCHNTYGELLIKSKFKKNANKKIKISYWGAIRQVDYNKKICDLFANDDRFEFFYHGDGAGKELKHYCERKKIYNIDFTGKYVLDDIDDFAKNTDIIFNAYDTDFVTTPSLAVKVYDSLKYHLPLVVSRDSFMDEYLNSYDFVFSFNAKDKKVLDNLYTWYMNLNTDIVENSFLILQDKIEQDEIVFRDKLCKFINMENYK